MLKCSQGGILASFLKSFALILRNIPGASMISYRLAENFSSRMDQMERSIGHWFVCFFVWWPAASSQWHRSAHYPRGWKTYEPEDFLCWPFLSNWQPPWRLHNSEILLFSEKHLRASKRIIQRAILLPSFLTMFRRLSSPTMRFSRFSLIRQRTLCIFSRVVEVVRPSFREWSAVPSVSVKRFTLVDLKLVVWTMSAVFIRSLCNSMTMTPYLPIVHDIRKKQIIIQ